MSVVFQKTSILFGKLLVHYTPSKQIITYYSLPAKSWCYVLKNKEHKTNTSLTTVHFEKAGNFLKKQLWSLVSPRNTGFYTWTLKMSVFILFASIWFFLKVLLPMWVIVNVSKKNGSEHFKSSYSPNFFGILILTNVKI